MIAKELRVQTAQVARIDGAVSGTPFLIALVPGYLARLWQEGVMERRIAALYGQDPRELGASAKVLVLRGVHPTADAAETALRKVRDTPLPERSDTRRPLRVWVHSIHMLLIFGGFLSAPSDELLRRRIGRRRSRDHRRRRGEDRGRTRRDVLRGALLALSIAVPIGFVAHADHVRQSTGINWLGALGALVAASLVIASTVSAGRR